MNRKIVQIAVYGSDSVALAQGNTSAISSDQVSNRGVIGLCSDGTLWSLSAKRDLTKATWELLPPIPDCTDVP